jgi:lambda repressor-like predicted transcriptional regulator
MARQARRLSELRPEEIKAAVRMAAETMGADTRKHDFSDNYRRALSRQLFKAKQIIAPPIGTPIEHAWPDRDYRVGHSLRHTLHVVSE